jgi:hypothetical protein
LNLKSRKGVFIPKTHGGFDVSKTRLGFFLIKTHRGNFVPKSRTGFYLRPEVVYSFWDFSDTIPGYVLDEDIRENPYRSGSKGLHL